MSAALFRYNGVGASNRFSCPHCSRIRGRRLSITGASKEEAFRFVSRCRWPENDSVSHGKKEGWDKGLLDRLLILRDRRVCARGNGFRARASGNSWFAFHLRRLNFRRRRELSLQFHPVVTGMPNIAGVSSLLASTFCQIRTAAIRQCQQRNEKQRRDFLHEACASCGSDCDCGCGEG